MTALDFSTSPRTTVLPPVFILPDLRANVAAAQAAGDVAHAAAQQQGAPNCEQADAYHTTFTAVMRELGTPVPCACAFCNPTEA